MCLLAELLQVYITLYIIECLKRLQKSPNKVNYVFSCFTGKSIWNCRGLQIIVIDGANVPTINFLRMIIKSFS